MMAAHLQAEKNWTEHVVVDGKLVTGQNPQVSSTAPSVMTCNSQNH